MDIPENQIDYFITTRRWKSNILNCRTYPGADRDTDHQLPMAKAKIRLKNIKREKQPQRYDITQIREGYRVEIKNRFEALMEKGVTESVEELWGEIKETVISTAEKHIPKKCKTKCIDWIKNAINEKRKIKSREGITSDLYKEHKKTVQAKCWKDKETYIGKICETLEEEAARGSSKGNVPSGKDAKEKICTKNEIYQRSRRTNPHRRWWYKR